MELLRPLTRLSTRRSGVLRPSNPISYCPYEYTSFYSSQQISLRLQPIIAPTRCFSSSSSTQQENTPAPPNANQEKTTEAPQQQEANQPRFPNMRNSFRGRSRTDVQDAANSLFGSKNTQQTPTDGLAARVLRDIETRRERDARENEDTIRLRLKPTLGRTVAVNTATGFDIQSAIAVLESSCRQNNVRVDERNQKVHVRRGQKKKNMKALRWRRMFKAGFVQEVGRIQRMRKQGW